MSELSQESAVKPRRGGGLAFVLLQAAFVAMVTALRADGQDARIAVDLGWIAAAGWAVAEWTITVQRERRGRSASVWFAAAAGSYFVATVIWAALDLSHAAVTFPSLADIFYLLTPLLLVSGLFGFQPDGIVHGYRRLQAANLGLVASAITILASFIIAPMLDGSSDSIAYILTTAAYWTIYTTAGSFTLLAIIGFRWGENRRLVTLLAAAMIAFLVATIPNTYDLIGHQYRPGNWYDVMWFVGPSFLALAAREFCPHRAERGDDRDAVSRATRLIPSVLMAGTVFVLGLNEARNLGGVPGALLLTAAIVIAVALTFRERAIREIEGVLGRRLEAALADSQENEDRFRHFAGVTSDFFIETDAELIIRKVIKGPHTLLTVAPERLMGRRLLGTDYGAEFHRNPPVNDVLAVMARRENFRNFELRLTLPDGRVVWRLYSGTPFFDRHNKFAGYRVSYQDVTAHRHLEADNARKTAELERVVDTMPGAFYRASTTGSEDSRIEYVSGQIERILGYTPAELLEQPALNLAPEGQAPLTLGAIATRGTWVARKERKLRLKRRDGRVVTVLEKSAMVEPRPDGRIVLEGLILDISEMEARDAEIAAGQRRLDLAVEHLSGWVFALSIDGRGRFTELYRSSGFERITGYTQEEFQNQMNDDLMAIVHPEDRRVLAENLVMAPDPNRVHERTFRLFTKAGELRWIRDRMRITRGPSGTLLMDGLALDITSRLAEEAAERRRSRLSAAADRLIGGKNVLAEDLDEAFRAMTEEAAEALNAARSGIWLYNDTQRNTVVAREMFDRRSHTHSGGAVVTRPEYPAHFDLLERGRQVVMTVSEDSGTYPDVKAHMRRMGMVSAVNSPIFRQGVLVGMATFARDSEQRWEAEELAFVSSFADSIALALEAAERRAAEERVRMAKAEMERVVRALDSALEIIFIIDSDGRVVYLNAAADQSRATRGQFAAVGRHYTEVFPALGEQRGNQVADIQRHLGTQGAWSGEISLQAGGQEHVFETRAAALADGGTIFAAIEVTERKARESNERALNRRLAQAEKMEAIGKLAGGIAHDFNNLIAAIRSFAGLIVFDLPADHPDRGYAERILATSDRAAELVRQILLFARAGNAERAPVAVTTLFAELEPMLRSALPANIKLYVTKAPDDAVIAANAGEILQVLMNLGVNAGDAAGASRSIVQIFCEKTTLSAQAVAELEPGVSTVAHPDGGGVITHRYVNGTLTAGWPYASMIVRDNGPGMTGDVVQRIFEPFFTTKSHGTGLGLAVVSGIVTAHGGAIVMVTGPEFGTSFQLFFPLSERRPAFERQELEADSLRGRERVLIVDDEIDVADGMSLALQRLGYETAPVYGPLDALEIFTEDPMAWDVVVTDQVMPEMRGLQLARKLKRLNAGVKIIVCTGYSDSATEKKALQAGASAFLHKPAPPETVAQAIRNSLREPAAT